MCRFSVEDDLMDGYRYTVGICTSALIDDSLGETFKTAAAVQVHKKTPDDHDHDSRHNIGSFENAEIMSGSKFLQQFSVLNEYFETNNKKC